MITQNQLMFAQRQFSNDNDQILRAQLRDFFFLQDNAVCQYVLKEDLKKWVESGDISRMKLITFDTFIDAFLQKICQVHKTPPIFKFDEKVNKALKDKFTALISETQLTRIFQDIDLKMRLHNTILVAVRYFEQLDKLYLDNTFNRGTCTVISYEGYEIEPKFVIRKKMTKDNKEIWVVWDRENKDQYYITSEPKYDYDSGQLLNEKINIDTREVYFPFITYRYQDKGYDFWQLGLDSLVELNRIINILYTIAGDDTIQETIRLLLLNFDPAGKGNEDIKGMKAGLRHPLCVENLEGGPTAEVVSADLYNDDILKLIDSLIELTSTMHGISTLTKAYVKENLSGIAIRLRNEPILQQWQKDINIVRGYDMELVKKIVEVNNYHRPQNQIDPKILNSLVIDYQSPGIVTDEKEDFELEKLKWEDGISSPVLWVMRKNPEMTEDEAQKFVENNLKVTGEFFKADISVPVIKNE